MLLAALDRGENDMGIIGYKFNMRVKLRAMMGHFEEDGHDIYSVATLLDPRCFVSCSGSSSSSNSSSSSSSIAQALTLALSLALALVL